jgi:pimeloyl-ACP methyl ester carboxylesterase
MDTFTNGALRFDVSDDGPRSGPAVVLLHGFPEDRQSWADVTPALNAAGYRTLAPDLRGYSPGARPHWRRDYRLGQLAGDVLALADQAEVDALHVVGHDWGAALAWYVAACYPERVRTLSAFSVPHPGAFTQAMTRSTQALRSWYMLYFQVPKLPERMFAARGGSLFRAALRQSGLDHRVAERYAQRAIDGQMTGPLNWYRALPLSRRGALPRVPVPTLYVWSDGDRFVTKAAAERCELWVTSPYRFETLAGVSHWIPEQEPQRSAELLLAHLRSSEST